MIGLVGSRLIGWAHDRLNADKPVVVELTINGEVVGRAAANRPPQELSPSQDPAASPGNCWFDLKIPAEYRAGQILNLAVRTEGGQAELQPSI